MSHSAIIEHYEAESVMRGLLDGQGFRNRVAGSCVYSCPRCGHRIRFRWRSFLQADGQSRLPRKLQRVLDDLTPTLHAEEQSSIDFLCPDCQAPTRVIFSVHNSAKLVSHFDIYAVLVGAEKHAK